MGRWATGSVLGTFAALLVACGAGSTSTTVSAGGETGTIPCPGSGCVGGYEFACDSDGNSAPAGACTDAGPVDAGPDGH